VYPTGRRLRRATAARLRRRVRIGTIGSYHGLVRSERSVRSLHRFHWHVLGVLTSGSVGCHRLRRSRVVRR
jgi:hypothetical protein